MRRLTQILTAAALIAIGSGALTSCFTGIESTPTITRRDVVRRGADNISLPGDSTDTMVPGEPPAAWVSGKMFYVTDPRISLILKGERRLLPEAGDTLVYVGIRPATSVTGVTLSDITFGRPNREGLITYRVNVAPDTLATRRRLDIPYTIELSVVEEARRAMLGNTYYIKTALWCDTDGNQLTDGRHLVPVRITEVLPGNETNPLRVLFVPGDNTATHRSVLMNASRQSFDKTFDTSDPRLQYPDISDANWQLITQSRIAPGMSKQECSLALGRPDDVERGYGYSSVHERWVYKSGRALIFTDGILTNITR